MSLDTTLRPTAGVRKDKLQMSDYRVLPFTK